MARMMMTIRYGLILEDGIGIFLDRGRRDTSLLIIIHRHYYLFETCTTHKRLLFMFTNKTLTMHIHLCHHLRIHHLYHWNPCLHSRHWDHCSPTTPLPLHWFHYRMNPNNDQSRMDGFVYLRSIWTPCSGRDKVALVLGVEPIKQLLVEILKMQYRENCRYIGGLVSWISILNNIAILGGCPMKEWHLWDGAKDVCGSLHTLLEKCMYAFLQSKVRILCSKNKIVYILILETIYFISTYY